ncbi:LOW QUALITY PROTEIN: zinc finger protein 667-like [Paramacrobiotus metropolitanus]|uniref:LOW QUALITY PROTEIN: zinc finger protein 667-like n=1 Tax=Paramacrobiotus metropolitanus TaxID=2943436 RepID=UPI0024457E15|nr:LOW QUALITY PROTEIN: zinc finger protein 667-like [Paramacrobiotus metropolitanus]
MSADVPLNLVAGCFPFDGYQLTLAQDEAGVLPQSPALPAHSDAQPPALRIVQREGSPEYPFLSGFGSTASDALSEEALCPGKRFKRSSAEKESVFFMSEERPFAHVYSLRGRNVVRTGLSCNDADLSDSSDENFCLSGNSDSSTTDAESCSEMEEDLEYSTTKKRGRKRRAIDARGTRSPPKIGAMIREDAADTGLLTNVYRAKEPNELPPARSNKRGQRHEEQMRRLNAVAKVNPFQFSSRKERRAAWTAAWQAYQDDAEVDHRQRKSQKVTFTWKYLRRYIKMHLDDFPQTLDRYNEDTARESRRQYIQVMRVIAEQAGKDYANNAHPLTIDKNVDAVGVDMFSVVVDTQNTPSTRRSVKNHSNSRYVSYVYRFVCWECSLHFKDENLLNLHNLQHSGAPNESTISLDCPACRRSFQKLPNLLHHVMDHGVKASQIVHFIPTADPTIMSFASGTAAPMDVLAQSHDAHETCFMYTCGLAQCGLRFCTETMADLHQLSHRVPDNYQGEDVCAGCNYVAAHAEDLLKHVARHGAKASDRKLCRLCGEFVENMVVHVQTNHKEEYLKYEAGLTLPCDHCDKLFRTSIHLATHKVWAHKGEQGRLRCLVCAKPFPTNHQLHAHVEKEHTTGLTCVVCQKSYSRYDRLYEHAKTHKEVHICPTCGSVFRSKRSLVQHEPIHRSDYSNAICDKAFKRSCNLSQHKMIVHTDKMRKKRQAKREEMRRKGVVSEYKCPRRRMRYDEFPYKCEECRLGWMLLGNLQQHQRKKHSDPTENVQTGPSHSVSAPNGNA